MRKIYSFVLCALCMSHVAIAQEVVGEPEKKAPAIKFRGVRSIDVNVTYIKFSPFNGEEKERYGEAVNVKVRIRPLRIKKMDVGGVFSYTDGYSDNYRPPEDRWSYYDYETGMIGASGVYHNTKNSATEAEISWLHQKTDGRVPKKNFWSHQHEQGLEFRVKYDNEERRAAGELWAPHWEIGARYIHPFDVNYYDSKGRGNDYAYDGRKFDLLGSVDLYDWYVDECDIWRITPTVNADLMYIWGKDSAGGQSGFGFKLAAYGEELLDVKFFNFRWMFGGDGSRVYDLIATIKLDNLGYSMWAAQTGTYVSPHKRAELAQAATQ